MNEKILTDDQVKGKLKSIGLKNQAEPKFLIYIYMIERFLERLSLSVYNNNFIIKGGMLVTSMVGTSTRSTMDVDATTTKLLFNESNILKIIHDIIEININDGVMFNIKGTQRIIEEGDNYGIRIKIIGTHGKILVPFDIDISTGDVITPEPINYSYKLLLSEKTIVLKAYNLETIISEKFHAILTKQIKTTRMKDFYDVYIFNKLYISKVNFEILNKAIYSTFKSRNNEHLLLSAKDIINKISLDDVLNKLWISYQNKFFYAKNISFKDTIDAINNILNLLNKIN